jgi:large subunit ribosomal protein L9
MELILKQDVAKLGYKDDIVKVKNGYGLNFLIPQGFAQLATDSAKKVHAENMKQRAFKLEKIKQDATKVADKLKGAILKIGAKAGESGKIYGSINTVQLAEAIKSQYGFDVERKNITISAADTVKSLGTYNASVKLHKEISVDIEFEVIAE